MQLPQAFRIRLESPSGAGIIDSFARVILMMSRKNHYSIWVGPSDSDGHVFVTREELFQRAREQATFFVMDSADPSETTGEFIVRPVTRDDLQAAIAAYEKFTPQFRYPPGWQAQLIRANEVLPNLPR